MENVNDIIKNNIKENIANNRLDEAKKLISEYEVVYNNDIYVPILKAIILIVENKIDQAKEILVNELKAEPNNFDINYNLGYIYYQKNEFSSAYFHYKKALEACTDLNLKDDLINLLKDLNLDNKKSTRKKIAFFVKKGLDSFLGDIIDGLSDEYEVKKIIVTDYNQIDKGMEWADICWFEWCDELISYGSWLNITKEKRIICRVHGYEVYTDLIRNPNWKNVDDLVIVAPHIKRIFEENTKDTDLGNLRIHSVFCGVNVEAYPLHLKSKGFNLGYLGYINFKKNIPLTLDIFKKLYDNDKRYKLFLAGQFQDTRTLEYVKYFIKYHNLEESILFDGWQNYEQKLQWLKKIDYIIISSIDEGLCFSAAEAMCSGIKPILHNCEGIKDHYNKRFIFSDIDEAVNMILSEEYNSIEYRNFIIQNYSLDDQMEKIKSLFVNLNELKKHMPSIISLTGMTD